MKSRDEEKDMQIRHLRRMVYAGITFQEIILTIDRIGTIGTADLKDRTLRYMAMVAIAVSYHRPFDNTAYGFGAIPKNFAEFPGHRKHADTHEQLIKGRMRAYAHYSPEQGAELLGNDGLAKKHLRIVVTAKAGQFLFHPERIFFEPDFLSRTRDLCEFQIRRIDKKVQSLITRLRGKNEYPDGEYVLGETFP